MACGGGTKMSYIVKKTFFCLLAAGALGGIAYAQEVRATIGGRVMDAQGALVPNSAVVVINDDNNVRQETKTNSQGALVPNSAVVVINDDNNVRQETKTNSQGALVPNAAVIVINDDNNVRKETKTNSQGVWAAGFLPDVIVVVD